MAERSTKPGRPDDEHYAAVYAQIVAKTWADDKFRAALLADPRKVLSDNGFGPAEYFDVRVVPGRAGAPTVEFPLPPKPANVDAKSIREFLSVAKGCCCQHCSDG